MNISAEKFSTKPCGKRLQKETRCYELLDKLGIAYVGVDHDHADTIELCLEIEKKLDCKICKNLFLCNRQQTEFYLLLMPGDKPFKTKFLSEQIHSSRLSFGTPEFMEKLLDITPGSVSVLGLMNDSLHTVKLLIDKDLLKEEYIGCHPCINTSTLKLKRDDILNVLLPFLGYAPVMVDLPVPEE